MLLSAGVMLSPASAGSVDAAAWCYSCVLLQVPLDLIEWQPVYHQEGATGVSGGEWSADWTVRGETER